MVKLVEAGVHDGAAKTDSQGEEALCYSRIPHLCQDPQLFKVFQIDTYSQTTTPRVTSMNSYM